MDPNMEEMVGPRGVGSEIKDPDLAGTPPNELLAKSRSNEP